MTKASRQHRALHVTGTVAVAAVLFACALVPSGCGRKGDSRLTVAAWLPEGDVDGRASVDVVFDRPVAAMGADDPSIKEGRKFLEIEPEIEGYYHWVGTRTLTYVVNGGLPPATRFKAKVRSGIRAVDGTKLKGDVTWEFTTPRPALVKSIPAEGDSLMRPEDPLLLVFNQPVDPDEAAGEIELEGGPDLRAARPDSAFLAGLGWEFRSVEPRHAVLLRPEKPLERDRRYAVRVKDSLRGMGGPLPIERERRVPFRTYGPPGVAAGAAGRNATLFFRTPVDGDSVGAYVTLDPPVPGLTTWGDGARVHLGGLEPATAYRVRVRAGLPDLFGQRLAEDVELRLETGPRHASLEILPWSGGYADAAVLPLASERQVALRFGGVKEVRLQLIPLTPADEIRYRFAPGNPVGMVAATAVVYSGPLANELRTQAIPVDRLVPPGGPGAVLVVAEATGEAQSNGEPRVLRDSGIVRWTDLAVTVKGGDHEGAAWVTALGTGRPVPGAECAITDPGGATLWTGRVDASGLVRLPEAAKLGDPDHLIVLARAGSDASIGRIDGNWRVAPWQMGIDTDYGRAGSDHRAFVYGDRDLYRPGETAHLSGLVRRFLPSGLGAATIDSVRVRVNDPLGAARADTLLALDRLGGFALDVPLAPEALAGGYGVQALLADAAREVDLGAGSFRVAAYRAASFKVEARLRPAVVTAGGTLEGVITGSYYFGSPLAGARARWTVARDPSGYHAAGYDDFSFGDFDERGQEAAVLASGEETLDTSGSAAIRVRLPEDPFAGFERLLFEAAVQDPSGDTVHGRASVLYTPASVVPGVDVPERVTVAGEEAEIRVVAVRADTALAAPGTALTVKLVRREWHSVRKLLVGGRVGYEGSVVDSLIGERAIVSAREPVSVRWPIAEPGSYRVTVEARDPQGRRARSSASFYASGGPSPAAAGPWEEEPFLRVTTDKKSYRPGETARVFVSTPVRARRAILSIEREGVLEARLVDLPAGSIVFNVPVKASYMPNVYVGVTLAEPEIPEAEAPGLPYKARLPRLRIGYVAIPIDVSSRRLGVTVAADRAEYRPGETAMVDVRVREASGGGAPARVSVAVVDESVLALLGTPNPDPFAFFYRSRGLGVRTDDTRLSLRLASEVQLAEEKAEAGGDGGGGPEYRSEFATVAHWSPAVFTDAGGRARVAVKLPDNLTRFRIVAVAAAGADRFGTGEGSLRVTQPLTLEAALPRFASVGDVFEAAAVLTNRSDHALEGVVTLESDLLVPDGAAFAPRSLRLEPGRGARVAFAVRAAAVGDARVRFRAVLSGVEDGVEVRLPIVEPRLTRTAAAAGRTSGSQPEIIQLPAESIPGSARLDLRLSPSAISGAEEAFRNVLDYPYGCLEQASSRLLAASLYKELAQSVNAGWVDSLALNARIAEDLRRLQSLRIAWGSFAFWPGGAEAPSWMNAYAAYALAQARHAGAPVPEDLLEHAAESVTEWLHRGSGRRDAVEEARSRPTGIFLFAAVEFGALTGWPVMEGLEIDAFVDGMPYLSAEDRIFLALALNRMGRRPEAVAEILKETRNRIQVTAAGALVAADQGSPVDEPMRTGVRGTALALLLAVRAHPEDPLVAQLAYGLLSLRSHGAWGSTQDNALAMLALTEYRTKLEAGAEAFDARVKLQGESEPLMSHAFAQGALEIAESTVALPASVAPGKPARLKVERAGGSRRGSLFYGAVLRWEEPAVDRAPMEGGFTLVRRVEKVEGEGAPALGDLVVVTLEVVVPHESWYLAIRDPLPAGLEAVHTDFEVESVLEARRLGRAGRYAPLPVDFSEIRDRERRLFADHVMPGVYEVRALARVRAVGTFAHPPAAIEAMYSPEMNAASGSPSFSTRR